MQARPKIVKIFVVALLVSLILAACGGGDTGKTWFNLPSAKVRVTPEGAMRLWGFNLGAFPQPELIPQLQAANIQQLEVRSGYNGIHVSTNGEELPYINWDEDKVKTLQEILPKLPQVPNGDTVASALPWLRTIGLGVLLEMPLAEGQSRMDIPRWSGETTITASDATTSTVGPMIIGSLTFDENGQASIEGVPVATIEKALGISIGLGLDPATQEILGNMAQEKIEVHVQPNGIDLAVDEKPLPGVAWDEQRLDKVMTDVPAFVSDPALVSTLDQVVPLLNSTDVSVAVGLNGEQAAETVLTPIELSVDDNGDVRLLGIPVAPGAVPPDALASLQEANVQQLALSLQPTGVYVAANGQTLPTITWTEESLPILAEVIGPMAGGSDVISTVLPVALGLGPNVKLNFPPASGATSITIPSDVTFAIQPITSTEDAPVINLDLAIGADGNLTQIGGFTAEEFASLGIDLPSLPPDSLAALQAGGVQTVTLDTEPGVLHVLFDGTNALDINYDQPSITTALDIAAPFMGDSPITTPAINQLLRETLLPMILTSDTNVNVDLE